MISQQEKKHILVFSLAFKPLIGGAEVALFEIARRLPQYHFDIVTLRFSHEHATKENFADNITAWRVGWGGSRLDKYLYAFLALRKALALNRQHPFLLEWSMMANFAGFAGLFMHWFCPRLPFFLTLQEGDPKEHIKARLGITYPLWKRIFKAADAIQTISVFLKQFAKEEGARVDPVVIPNGVNVALFEARNQEKEEALRRELHILPEDFVLITTSRLVIKNGIDTAIKALPLLGEKVPHYKFLILGTGPEEKNLRALAIEKGVMQNIIFAGDIPQEDLPPYLHISNAFVRLSRSEGLGNSFLEAMASGIPILGTLVGGIPDFLEDGVTGLAAKAEDEKDAAEKMARLATDQELYATLVQKGTALIQKSYNWDSVAQAMEKLMLSIVKPRVAIATGIYPPDIGGPATYVASFAAALKESGADVSILTYSDIGGAAPGVQKVSRRSPLVVRYLVYFLRLYAAALQSDFIYAFDGLSSGLPAMLVSFLSGVPFVLRLGGDRLWEKKTDAGLDLTYREFYSSIASGKWGIPQSAHLGRKDKALYIILKTVARQADLVIFSTQWQKEILATAYGLKDERVIVITNAFNVTPSKEEKLIPEVRQGLLYEEETEGAPAISYVLFAGRLVKFKNLPRFFKALSLLQERRVLPFVVRIVGDGPERAGLVKLAKEYGVAEKVHFSSSKSNSFILQEIQGARFCVLPSLTEMSPNFALECIGARKPIILTKENGIAPPLESRGIVLINPKDESDILKALEQMLDQNWYDDALKSMEDARVHTSWDEVVARHREAWHRQGLL